MDGSVGWARAARYAGGPVADAPPPPTSLGLQGDGEGVGLGWNRWASGPVRVQEVTRQCAFLKKTRLLPP